MPSSFPILPNSDDVIDVKETGRGTSGEITLNREHRYTRTFVVVVKTTTVPASIILRDTRIPQLGDTYILIFSHWDGAAQGSAITTDADSKVNQVSINRRSADDPLIWDVTVTYDIAPLSVPTEITCDGELFQVPARKDLQDDNTVGLDIVNAVGDPFDPPPTKEDSRDILRVRYNKAYTSISDFITFRRQFNNKTNLNAFLGQSARMWKCQNINGIRKVYGAIYYWEVSIEFHFNEDEWKLKLLQQGFNYLEPTGVGDEKRLVKARDNKDFSAYSGPVLLNVNGTRHTVPVTLLAPAVYSERKVYPTVDFDLIGIPGITG